MSCEDALEEYATLLSGNPDLLPTLQVYGADDCGGETDPSTSSQINKAAPGECYDLSLPTPRSLFMPEMLQATVYTGPGCSGTAYGLRSRTGASPNAEVLVTQATQLGFVSGVELLPTVKSFRVAWSSSPPFRSEDEFKLALCQNRTVFFGGSYPYSAYGPGTLACDKFVNEYCATSAQNLDSSVCNCIRDQQTLDKSFPDVDLPVTCLGANCAQSGYRTSEMIENPCSVVLCDNIVEEFGNELSANGNGTIFCGNTNFFATPNPTLSFTMAPEESGSEFPAWAYVVIFGSLAVVAIVLAVVFSGPSGTQAAGARALTRT